MIMPGPQNLKDYFAMLWVFSLQWLQRSSKSNMSIFTHNYAQLQNILEHCREWAGRGGHLRCSKGLPDSLVKRCSTRSEDLWKSPDVESKALMKLQIMFAFCYLGVMHGDPRISSKIFNFFRTLFSAFSCYPSLVFRGRQWRFAKSLSNGRLERGSWLWLCWFCLN